MTYNPDHDTFAAPDRRQTLQQQWREVSARIDAEDAARRAAEAEPAALLPAATDAAGRTLRHDGWTPDRQRAFLAAIAEGETVERACRVVGLTVSSAYAFRQRAAGAGFALGWRAASLLARDRLADRMMARAIDGQVETVTRPDGSTVTRHRFDNGAAMRTLARLDRLAEQAPEASGADPAAAAQSHAARLIAQDFEAFLDTIEQDRGLAQVGLFLARRTGLTGSSAAAPPIVSVLEPVLAPILALARADLFTRTGASLPQEIDVADLDPAQRHTWTAEQWQRADAAGLLHAVARQTGDEAPLPPLVTEGRGPVWWDEDREAYRTSFPLAADAEWVDQDGRFGDPDYERDLTDDEQALFDQSDDLDREERRVTEAAARDAWFAGLQAEIAVAAEAAKATPTGEGDDGDHPRLPGARRGPVAGCPPGEDGAATPLVLSDIETLWPEAESPPQADAELHAAQPAPPQAGSAGARTPLAAQPDMEVSAALTP